MLKAIFMILAAVAFFTLWGTDENLKERNHAASEHSVRQAASRPSAR